MAIRYCKNCGREVNESHPIKDDVNNTFCSENCLERYTEDQYYWTGMSNWKE